MNDLCIVNCASNMANYHEMGLVSGLELVHLPYGMTRFTTTNFLPCIVMQNTASGKNLLKASMTGGIRGALEVTVTRKNVNLLQGH